MNPTTPLPELWDHPIVPLLPTEVRVLQRAYVSRLRVPTLSDLDLRLREGLRAVGVRIDEGAVAFALIADQPPPGFPAPLLVGLGAPGQSTFDLRLFLRALVRQQNIRSLWGRSDDSALLEVLMLEGWTFQARGPLLLMDQARPPIEGHGFDLRHLERADLDAAVDFFSRQPELPREEGDREHLRKSIQDQLLDGLFHQGRLLAVSRLIPQQHPSFVSLHLLVDPAHRQQGLARILGLAVVNEELAAERFLIAAFDSNQVASRRLVESLGAEIAAVYYLATPPAIAG